MDFSHLFLLVLIGVAGGVFGSMMGVGGGVFVVPLLTLAAGLPVKEAIACSLVAVAGTACASAASYVKFGFTNVRLGLLLETTTTAGAIVGALLATVLNARVLAALFGLVLIYTAYSMFRRINRVGSRPEQAEAATTSRGLVASLSAEFHDGVVGGAVRYRVRRLKLGLGVGALGGLLSGLLGIGGGVVKVPAMNLFMGVPMKAAVGTSSFMIGITAVASAFVYYQRGYMDVFVAAPVFAGVFLGVQIGVLAVQRVQAHVLKLVFSVILLMVAVLMLLRAAGVVE